MNIYSAFYCPIVKYSSAIHR